MVIQMEIGNQLKEQTAKNVINCYNDLAKEVRLLNSINSFDCVDVNEQFNKLSDNIKSLIIEIGAISERMATKQISD